MGPESVMERFEEDEFLLAPRDDPTHGRYRTQLVGVECDGIVFIDTINLGVGLQAPGDRVGTRSGRAEEEGHSRPNLLHRARSAPCEGWRSPRNPTHDSLASIKHSRARHKQSSRAFRTV